MPIKVTGRYRNITPRVGRGGRFGLIGQLPQVEPVGVLKPASLTPGLPEEFVELSRPRLSGIRQSDRRAALEKRAVPVEQVYGSLEERILYKELMKRQIPFDFQSSMIGPRRVAGAIISDFLLLDRPVVIWVNGGIWHRGISAETRDTLQIDQLAFMGFESLQIWDHILWEATLTDMWFRQYIDVPIVRPLQLEQVTQMRQYGRIITLPTRIGVPIPRR